MNILDNLTLFTCTFNNNLLTKCMIMSCFKQIGVDIPVVIMDNGTTELCTDDMKEMFTVIDNSNFKLTNNYKQISRNHCSSIDYALKNCINTKYVMLCDNDILFKPEVKNLLMFLDTFEEIDACGEIQLSSRGYRLFPFFCIINVEKMNNEHINYFDVNNCMNNLETNFDKNGNWVSNKCITVQIDGLDTGGSFLSEIKNNQWDIKEIKINNFIKHFASASWHTPVKKNILSWLTTNKNLIQQM